MIHQVRLPQETRLYLRQVVRVQLGVLRCAVNLQDGFTKDDLENALQGMPTIKAKAQEVAAWVWGHKDTREGLQRFAAGTPAAKANLVEQMYRDVLRLYKGRLDETLECRFQANRDACVQGARVFLVSFYEQLGNGLDMRLFCHNPYRYTKYGREQFFAAFERENPELGACAICDEHRYMTILRGRYFSDIEHYFPKSIYPHLSCHPYNLIPLCKQCNQAHLDRDPLETANGRCKLRDVFLPYRGDSVARRGAIKLDWQHRKQKPHLQIQLRQDNDAVFQARLQAFSAIYDIPGRWQNRIHQIGEHLWRYIRHYVRIEIEKGEEIDLLKLKGELEKLLGYLFEDLGKSPWAYVLIWYLGNILVEEVENAIQNPAPSGVIPVLDTIRDVLRHDKAADSRLRAKEVLETARKLYASRR
ncbi:MAG TPA: hypothetical protein GX400_05055 [Chloroflexi bacterium]|nr:hypothetical protein [Chloroflexota bacterium]